MIKKERMDRFMSKAGDFEIGKPAPKKAAKFIIERALEAQAHEMIKAEYKRFQKAMAKEAE